ncbi:Membralin-like protein, partial [Thalictrum thalictroides]
MDPEETFIRVQERFSQILAPRFRIALEYIYMVVAVSLFALLVVMHANYVQQPGCSSELSVVETTEAQLVHIKINSIGLHSYSEVESNAIDNPVPLPSTENVEVPTVDGDGLTFWGAKFWLNWIGSGARRSKLVLKSSKADNEYLEPHADSSIDVSSSKPVGDEKENTASVEDLYTSFSVS